MCVSFKVTPVCVCVVYACTFKNLCVRACVCSPSPCCFWPWSMSIPEPIGLMGRGTSLSTHPWDHLRAAHCWWKHLTPPATLALFVSQRPMFWHTTRPWRQESAFLSCLQEVVADRNTPSIARRWCYPILHDREAWLFYIIYFYLNIDMLHLIEWNPGEYAPSIDITIMSSGFGFFQAGLLRIHDQSRNDPRKW